MISETVILLSAFEDCSKHKFARYIDGHLVFTTDININYYKPLQQIFSRVIAYDFVKQITEIGIVGINMAIIRLVKKEHPKYVIWLSSMYELLKSTLDAIREEGSIVIGWFVDDEYRFASYFKWWIPHVDYCVSGDIEAVEKYKALGARVIHIFPCVGVPIERNWVDIDERYNVSFVGWRDKVERERYVNEIKKRGIPIATFGRGWEGGYVSAEDMIDIFKTSKINLNFSGAGGGRKGNKGRITEVCLAGGFLLTEYAPDLENYFKIGKEIAWFRNAEEMIDNITYYLSHNEERRAIAKAGWEKATNEYTPYHMFVRVFNEIEKDVASAKVYNPQRLKMPMWIRNMPSKYYFQWGRAFLEEGYDGLAEDTLALSLLYNPFKIGARYYSFIDASPYCLQHFLFKLYIPFEAVGKICSKGMIKLLVFINSMPYLGSLKRSVSKRLCYS